MTQMKYCPSSVGASSDDTHGCRSPPWRCRWGVSPSLSFGVSGWNPRFRTGLAWWWCPRRCYFVGIIAYGDMVWRLYVAFLWCCPLSKINLIWHNNYHRWWVQHEAFLETGQAPPSIMLSPLGLKDGLCVDKGTSIGAVILTRWPKSVETWVCEDLEMFSVNSKILLMIPLFWY
jgi:hypothetical protein